MIIVNKNNSSKKIRLLEIASLVPYGTNVYDVGADHGELERFLADKCPKIMAVENKIGPYSRLVKSVANFQNVTPIMADGLKMLTKECSTVVLAGLGAINIVNILKRDLTKLEYVQHLVIDAHRDLPLLRKSINQMGYIIDKESIVFEKGIYYVLMRFKKGNIIYNEDEILFGISLEESANFPQYIENEVLNKRQIIINAKHDKERVQEIENYLARLQRYYENKKNYSRLIKIFSEKSQG